MDWLLSTLLIVGILAFFAQAFLKLASSDSTIEVTSTWKWQTALSLIAGFCLFILLGLVTLWGGQGQGKMSGLLIGVALLMGGVIFVWNSLSAFFKIKANANWVNALLLIVGLLLIFGVGSDLWVSFQGNGEGLSLENLVLVLVSFYTIITGFRRLRTNVDEKVESLSSSSDQKTA